MSDRTGRRRCTEDVNDHRLNDRAFSTNPVFEFLYRKMNHHIGHPMFAVVPVHRLPEMHVAIGDHCPPVYPSVRACYREMIPAIRRQLKEPGWYVDRPLPGTGVAAE